MSVYQFFSELFCQLCRKRQIVSQDVRLNYFNNCPHFVCHECVSDVISLKTCQIFNCGKKFDESRKREISGIEVDDKYEKTLEYIISRYSKGKPKQYFYYNRISPISPVLVAEKPFSLFPGYSIIADTKWIIRKSKLNFSTVKKSYFSFKERLKSESLMLRPEIQLEELLKAGMQQMTNLKISEFFENISCFFIKFELSYVDISSRLLNRIEALFERCLQKKFSFKLYSETVHQIFDVFDENDFEMEAIDQNSEVLVEFDSDISRENSDLNSKMPWPSHFKDQLEESFNPQISLTDSEKVLEENSQKKVDEHTFQERILRQKNLRKLYRMDSLIKFRINLKSAERVVSKSSILKKRMAIFLCFLFPQMTKWSQLLHLKTDRDSEQIWKHHCQNQLPIVIIFRSGKYLVGAFADQKSPEINGYKESSRAFLFSIYKKKKYSIQQKIVENQRFQRPLFLFDNNGLFAFGSSIRISSSFHLCENFAKLGEMYETDEKVNRRTELFGSNKIIINEMEFFKVE